MSVLKKAIETFDPAQEKRNEIETALNLLFELAQAKCENQEKTIVQSLRTAGTEDNATIPISQILSSQYDIRCYVDSDSTKIEQEAITAVRGFISGGSDNVVNGIAILLAAGINTLLASGTGLQKDRKDYFIAVDGMSIVRIDIMTWMRRISVIGITKRIDAALAFTAVKSSVDVNKISFNTFLHAYKYQLENAKIEQNILLEEIKKAKEVFELLKDKQLPSIPEREAILNIMPSATVGFLGGVNK
jgi:hypothetical protein